MVARARAHTQPHAALVFLYIAHLGFASTDLAEEQQVICYTIQIYKKIDQKIRTSLLLH